MISIEHGEQAAESGRLAIGDPGDWVTVRDIPSRSPGSPDDPVSVLLRDVQRNVATWETYRRTVTQLNNAEGVRHLSQVEIAFEPELQTLMVHSIAIWRDGQRMERSAPSKFKVVQRETNLERQIFDGNLSALLLVEDVRVGDIIDVSFTLQMDHPDYLEQYATLEQLQFGHDVGELHVSLTGLGEGFRWRSSAGEIDPVFEGGRWYLKKEDLPRLESPANLPAWYPYVPMVEFSQYESWDEVGKWIAKLWERVDERSEALAEVTREIFETADSEMVRLNRAVDFVQREIRYLGIESGIGSHQPSSVEDILRRRFGDCKDKSYLLASLLRAGGLKTSCALVSSIFDRSAKECLPSPYVFDHVIVACMVDGKLFWIDATNQHQRGPVEKRWPPSFGQAFVFGRRDKPGRWTEIKPPGPDTSLLRVRDEYTVRAGENPVAVLKRETMARGLNAGGIRALRDAIGPAKFEEIYENSMKAVYSRATRQGGIEFVDDAENDSVIVREEYRVTEFTGISADGRTMFATFFPMPIRDTVSPLPPDKMPEHPWALAFPAKVRNRIRIHLPWRTKIKPEKLAIDSPAFLFNFESRQRENKMVELLFGYDGRADHVPVEQLARYRADFDRMANSAEYILSLSGSRGMEWDGESHGGNPGTARRASRREGGKRKNVAWAGPGTFFLILLVILVRGLISSANDSTPRRPEKFVPPPPTTPNFEKRTEAIMDRIKSLNSDDTALPLEKDLMGLEDPRIEGEIRFNPSSLSDLPPIFGE